MYHVQNQFFFAVKKKISTCFHVIIYSNVINHIAFDNFIIYLYTLMAIFY